MKSAFLIGLIAVSSAAVAQPVGIDGAIGGEWTGAYTAVVTHNPAAPNSNFGAPTNQTDAIGYTVYTRQDAQYLYVGVLTNSAAGGPPLNVIGANLYFGGNLSVGFETTNDRAFIPGVFSGGPGNNGLYPLAGLDGTAYEVFWASAAVGGSDWAIELAVPILFFMHDPLGMGFNTLSGAPGDDFTRISLSQSFGYSVGGGQAFYGTERLGAFYNVPAPGAAAALGLAGLAAFRRRR